MTYCFQPVITILYDRASQDASVSFCCKHHAVGRRHKPCPRQAAHLGRVSGGNGKGPSVTQLPGFPRNQGGWRPGVFCFVSDSVSGWGGPSPIQGSSLLS